MKPRRSIALSTWMLDHLTFGYRNDALSGDLLEELHSGRSANWYRRQVLSAIAIGLLQKSRDCAVPLFFSLAWSALYPAWWRCLIAIWSAQTLSQRWNAIDWPYSTSLHGIGEFVPAIAFVWLGFFVYVLLRTEKDRRVSALRLFAGLSISLNVLTVTTIALWRHLNSSGAHLSYVARENFYLNPHLIDIGIPLILALLSAIAAARPLRHNAAFHAG